MYVLNNPEGPTMLFCNPNAGFYEFSFFQSEWFEFYQKFGVNLMLWNYPGYGRSKGSPTLLNVLQDGEAIIEYLRGHKKVSLLGVHGESLGGCVAVHLAYKCALNFVFADRTFASLTTAALYNFGKLAYLGFKVAGTYDSDSVHNYLNAKCYKVISCDPSDIMISDLASLKTRVAASVLYDKFPTTHILYQEHMIEFTSSLKRLYFLLSKLLQIENISKENTNLGNTSTYQPLREDSELFESEKFRLALQKIKNLLNGIDAGGVSLMQCLKSKRTEEALVAWILVFDVWGTSFQSTRISPLQVAVDILKAGIRELETIFDVEGITKEVTSLHLALNAIKTHLETRIDSFDNRSLNSSNELKNEIDYEKAGFLIPLNCGHGGPYSSQERLIYEKHLIRARFINYNYQ